MCFFSFLIRVHWSVTIVCFMMFFECKGLEAVLSSCPFPIFILFFSHSFFGKKFKGIFRRAREFELLCCPLVSFLVTSLSKEWMCVPSKCSEKRPRRNFLQWTDNLFYRSPFHQQNVQKCFLITRKLDSTQVSFKNKKICTAYVRSQCFPIWMR